MADAKTAVRQASALVAQAITALVEVGPDAPVVVREALERLGCCYSQLGYADPGVPYGLRAGSGEMEAGEPF